MKSRTILASGAAFFVRIAQCLAADPNGGLRRAVSGERGAPRSTAKSGGAPLPFDAAYAAATRLRAATTDGQPSRTLRYFGSHAETDLSLRLEILCERDSSSLSDPSNSFIQTGKGRGAGTPRACASESK